jgi:hypothetical protein
MGDSSSPSDMKQVPYRIHRNDYVLLRQLMTADHLTFQSLVKTCVEAYMKGDPLVMRMLRQHKELESVPKSVIDRYTLSQRERQALLEQLEREQDKEEIKP